MEKIAKSLIELIGHTPLLELTNFNQKKNLKGTIIVKLESFNPLGSAKDRAALGMIQDAEEKGILKPGSVLIEPTSGNTGVGLAFLSAIKGYHLILTMPETMSMERRRLLSALGAELILTPGEKGMNGAIEKAKLLLEENPDAFWPNQFGNPANSAMHQKTTAQEIWEDTEGSVDYFVAGVGTGGTLTGVARGLKEKNPEIRIVAVEPFDSAVLSGEKAGPHKIQGIGAGFVPDIFEMELVDEIIKVKNEDAFDTARLAAKTDGVLMGISSGAALYAAAELAFRPENEGKRIVVILPDTGERYLSTNLFETE